MSFVVYFAVILVAAASALFGLDLLTAPLPPKPPGQIASLSTPKQQTDKQANNRALSPTVPANPAESKDVRMVYPPSNETTGANGMGTGGAPAQALAKSSDAQAAASPQQPEPQQPQQPIQSAAPQVAAAAPAQPAAPDDKTDSQHATAPAPATEPVAQRAAGRCDIQSCTRAYSSFRPSDCTYQPFSGPRRVCGAPPPQKRATASVRPKAFDARAERVTRDWDARRNPELDDAVRGVRQWPDAQDDDDANSYKPRRGRVIILERDRGFWR
jgi:hypothetical protein